MRFSVSWSDRGKIQGRNASWAFLVIVMDLRMETAANSESKSELFREGRGDLMVGRKWVEERGEFILRRKHSEAKELVAQTRWRFIRRHRSRHRCCFNKATSRFMNCKSYHWLADWRFVSLCVCLYLHVREQKWPSVIQGRLRSTLRGSGSWGTLTGLRRQGGFTPNISGSLNEPDLRGLLAGCAPGTPRRQGRDAALQHTLARPLRDPSPYCKHLPDPHTLLPASGLLFSPWITYHRPSTPKSGQATILPRGLDSDAEPGRERFWVSWASAHSLVWDSSWRQSGRPNWDQHQPL